MSITNLKISDEANSTGEYTVSYRIDDKKFTRMFTKLEIDTLFHVDEPEVEVIFTNGVRPTQEAFDVSVKYDLNYLKEIHKYVVFLTKEAPQLLEWYLDHVDYDDIYRIEANLYNVSDVSKVTIGMHPDLHEFIRKLAKKGSVPYADYITDACQAVVDNAYRYDELIKKYGFVRNVECAIAEAAIDARTPLIGHTNAKVREFLKQNAIGDVVPLE